MARVQCHGVVAVNAIRLRLMPLVWRYASWLALGVILFLLAVTVGDAYAQSFDFGSICAGQVQDGSTIIEQCRFDENFLQQVLLPFDMVTGGFISLIFWGVICIAVYLKYHNAMIALLVGVPILMTAALAIPDQFGVYIGLLAATAVAVTIFILYWKIPRD